MSTTDPFPTISVGQLHALSGPALIDVREPAAFAQGHVPGAVNFPLADIKGLAGAPEQLAAVLPSGRPLHVICQTGVRSREASKILSTAGVDVVNVDGGTKAWIDAGYPVTQ
jgi:rhodanese-related sulfurtransferase